MEQQVKTVKREKSGYYGMSLGIRVKAMDASDNRDGTFTIRIPAVEVNPELLKGVLEVLPDLIGGFEKLLMKQALLSALDERNF